MKDELYQTLGVDRSASGETIKRAYRKRAKATHPDVNPEAGEEFQKVQRAYLVLSAPVSRARYDRDGVIGDNADNEHVQILNIVAGLMEQVVQQVQDAVYDDVVEIMRRGIKDQSDALRARLRLLKKQITRLERVTGRFKSSTQRNVLREFVERKIAELKGQVELQESELKLADAVIKFLADYSFEADERPRDMPQFFSMRTGTAAA